MPTLQTDKQFCVLFHQVDPKVAMINFWQNSFPMFPMRPQSFLNLEVFGNRHPLFTIFARKLGVTPTNLDIHLSLF
jgi:hypothetical protein